MKAPETSGFTGHKKLSFGTTAMGWVLIALFLTPVDLQASWNLSFDADARGTWTRTKDLAAEIHALGLSIRKSFSDNSGDRFILSGLFETENNFSEFMIHELYFRYKGPMGLWNITVGRIGIPYGLLTSFSTTRLLFENPVEEVIGFDADNGIMVSGVAGIFDYGISLSQGYGVHRTPDFPGEGLGAGRIGVTLGDAEEYSFGLSISGGKTVSGHTGHIHSAAKRRISGGIDATANIGQTVIRTEVNAGEIDKHRIYSGFGLVDHAFHYRLDLSAGLQLQRSHDAITSGGIFAGFTFKPPWFTVRGGYIHDLSGNNNHKISLQLYRLFSYTF